MLSKCGLSNLGEKPHIPEHAASKASVLHQAVNIEHNEEETKTVQLRFVHISSHSRCVAALRPPTK